MQPAVVVPISLYMHTPIKSFVCFLTKFKFEIFKKRKTVPFFDHRHLRVFFFLFNPTIVYVYSSHLYLNAPTHFNSESFDLCYIQSNACPHTNVVQVNISLATTLCCARAIFTLFVTLVVALIIV